MKFRQSFMLGLVSLILSAAPFAHAETVHRAKALVVTKIDWKNTYRPAMAGKTGFSFKAANRPVSGDIFCDPIGDQDFIRLTLDDGQRVQEISLKTKEDPALSQGCKNTLDQLKSILVNGSEAFYLYYDSDQFRFGGTIEI